MFYTGG